MTEPRSIRLVGPSQRAYAIARVQDAPDGHIVEFKEPTRSNMQNDKMWAMLTDVSRSKPGGRHATPETWKLLMMNACGFECQFEMGIDGRPFPSGFKSSKLTVAQMGELLTFIDAWGTSNGVRWTDPEYLRAA